MRFMYHYLPRKLYCTDKPKRQKDENGCMKWSVPYQSEVSSGIVLRILHNMTLLARLHQHITIQLSFREVLYLSPLSQVVSSHNLQGDLILVKKKIPKKNLTYKMMIPPIPSLRRTVLGANSPKFRICKLGNK